MSRKRDPILVDLVADRASQAYGLAWGCGLLFLLFTGLILALSSS